MIGVLMWPFLGLFVIISIILEMLEGIFSGYYKPIDAGWRISGVIIGTIIFWNFLKTPYIILVGSKNDFLISEIVSVIALCFGIFLRILIEERRYRNNDNY